MRILMLKQYAPRSSASVLPVLYLFTTIASPTYAAGPPGQNTTGAMQSETATINISLEEWHIKSDKQEVRAGDVTFRVINLGKEDHELVIIKTDLDHKRLPREHGKVNESKAGELIGEIEEFSPGQSREATFTLAPGNYVLFCNIVEHEENGELESHYHEGMHMPFKVVR